MISNLKEACGFEYTHKLSRVSTDVNLSEDLTDQATQRMEQSHDQAAHDELVRDGGPVQYNNDILSLVLLKAWSSRAPPSFPAAPAFASKGTS